MLPNSEKDFLKRHIGPSKEDQSKMLKELNYQSLDDLIDSTVPEKIKFRGELNIGESNSEYEALRKLRSISKKNQVYSNFIGMGYYGTYTSRSLVGSSSSNTLAPCLRSLARCKRLRSPPERSFTNFCWSDPLKLKRPT